MKQRENWGTRSGFVLAAIGSALGLGNIWRFPYLAYENGGGAFLIPYFIALFTAGIPIIIIEMGIGHKNKASPALAFAKMSRKFAWLGWMQVFISFIISLYYSVVVAWALSYTFFATKLSWGSDPEKFFYKDFLNASSGPLQLGGFVPEITIFVVLIWIFVWLTLFSGIKKGIESIAKIFMPLLFFLILLMIIKTLSLSGSASGLNWLFEPNLESIFDFKTWTAAYGQIFFSLSICFGIMIAYSSYLPKNSDIANNATMTALINCGCSLLAGILIFGILGYYSTTQGIPMEKAAESGIGLAFVAIPVAINLLPAPIFFGILLFLALFVAGFTSIISIIEVCCSTIIDKFNIKRSFAVSSFCIIGCILSLIFTTNGGVYILDIVDHFINNFGIVFAGIFEIIFMAWIFKLKTIREYINEHSEFHVGAPWQFCLRFIVPIFLGYIAIRNLVGEIFGQYENYPQEALIFYGWIIIILMILLSFLLQVFYNRFKKSEL